MDSNAEAGTAGAEYYWEQTSEGMDRSMLMARDPILFWDEVPLYESELDDNGVSQLRVKVSILAVTPCEAHAHPVYCHTDTEPSYKQCAAIHTLCCHTYTVF